MVEALARLFSPWFPLHDVFFFSVFAADAGLCLEIAQPLFSLKTKKGKMHLSSCLESGSEI